MKKIDCIMMCVALMMVGCIQSDRVLKDPLFNNHDIVRILDTGEQAKVTDNKAGFDGREDCWKVKIEINKEWGKIITVKNETDLEAWVEGG